MAPTIYLQGERSLLCYQVEVSLQKDVGATLLSHITVKYNDFNGLIFDGLIIYMRYFLNFPIAQKPCTFNFFPDLFGYNE